MSHVYRIMKDVIVCALYQVFTDLLMEVGERRSRNIILSTKRYAGVT